MIPVWSAPLDELTRDTDEKMSILIPDSDKQLLITDETNIELRGPFIVAQSVTQTWFKSSFPVIHKLGNVVIF